MKKVFQLTDMSGNPLGGHVFIAPDEPTLHEEFNAAQRDGVVFTEVEDESLVIPAPMMEVIDEPAP